MHELNIHFIISQRNILDYYNNIGYGGFQHNVMHVFNNYPLYYAHPMHFGDLLKTKKIKQLFVSLIFRNCLAMFLKMKQVEQIEQVFCVFPYHPLVINCNIDSLPLKLHATSFFICVQNHYQFIIPPPPSLHTFGRVFTFLRDTHVFQMNPKFKCQKFVFLLHLTMCTQLP